MGCLNGKFPVRASRSREGQSETEPLVSTRDGSRKRTEASFSDPEVDYQPDIFKWVPAEDAVEAKSKDGIQPAGDRWWCTRMKW